MAQIFTISKTRVVHSSGYAYPFNYAVMPFLAELFKLTATFVWTVLQGKQGDLFRNNTWQKWRVYAVLAFIYVSPGCVWTEIRWSPCSFC